LRSGRQKRLVVAHEDVTDVQRTTEALQEVSGRLLGAQEEERRRIARELHDSTTQHLVAATMSLARLEPLLRGGPGDAGAIVTELRTCIERSLKEIRDFSYLLHPPLLSEFGLRPAISEYLSELGRRSGLAVALDVDPDLPRLQPALESALFRIVQEAFANILRHAEARGAVLRLHCTRQLLRVEVEDDGKGMPAPLAKSDEQRPLGVGIAGMRARMRQFGGTLVVEPAAKGTRVKAVVPLHGDMRCGGV
jgi:signal transduction histidine kinase